MKALSIRQPWAWAILHAGKRIENRGWSTRHRGPILLHASAGLTKREYQEFQMFWEQFPRRPLQTYKALPPMSQLQRGGIVGKAVLVDVIHESEDIPPDGQHDWFFGPYGLVLDQVQPVDCVPYKGEPGLFNVPADLVGERAYG